MDELLNAEALAELEGWGQAKRLVARVCAEIHNAVTNAVYVTSGTENAKPPKPLDEKLFLPRRVKRPMEVVKADSNKQDREKVVQTSLQKASRILNALAGF
jgi:hypothetical protein